jgi:hypothetical protein
MCELVPQYTLKWSTLFDQVTPKLHVLAYHLSSFLVKHQTVTIPSLSLSLSLSLSHTHTHTPHHVECYIQVEQSLERQHKHFNRLDPLYRTMADNNQRMRAILQQSHLQACYDVVTRCKKKFIKRRLRNT